MRTEEEIRKLLSDTEILLNEKELRMKNLTDEEKINGEGDFIYAQIHHLAGRLVVLKYVLLIDL